MKTAAEWRQAYFLEHGRSVEPGTMLGDILTDLRTLEDANAALTSRLDSPSAFEDEIHDLHRDLAEMADENRRLQRKLQATIQHATTGDN